MQQRWASKDPVATLRAECGVELATHLIANHEMCGTAYCRAGWMLSILYDGPVSDGDYSISAQAYRLLGEAGVPPEDIEDLFKGSQAGPISTWGTPGYVQKGIDGMRAFMAKHEKKLKKAQLIYGEKPGDVKVKGSTR